MKNKEKEIEEMSREICSEYDCVIPCQSCGYYGYANCRDVKSAEKLYIAGYRKASDVAGEIFEEIRAESSYCVASQNGVEIYHTKMYNISAIKLDELKKKYINK